MAMLGRLRALVIKELLAVWRDRKSRFVLIWPPLVQIFVLSYAATYDVTHVTLAVLDKDNSPQSRELIARFEGAPAMARVTRVANEREMAAAVDSRRAMFALHIGQDFSRQLSAARPAGIQLVFDGRSSNTAQVLQGYAAEILADFNRDWARDHRLPAPPSPLEARAWFNPNLDSLWVVVPGLVGILTMTMGIVVTALSVAREREVGTFEQLLVTPLRPVEILLGKTVPALLVGLVEGTIIVVAALAWFRLPFHGSFALLYGSLVVFMLSVIGVGLFLSSLVRTQQQAILGAFLFMVPAVILSGFATPLENMPDWIQVLTYANPLRYFLIIAQGIFLKGLPAELVLQQVWPMAVIGTITMVGAGWLFRRGLN